MGNEIEAEEKTNAPQEGSTASNVAAQSTWADTARSYRWPLAFIVLAAIAAGVALRFFDAASGAISSMTSPVTDIAEKFQSKTITTTFKAALPELSGESNLEVASCKVLETLSKEDEKKILWDNFSLGKTASEIRVSVTYRYHVPLNGYWQLEQSSQTCLVVAPKIAPTLPPAIHTDTMEKKTDEGWLRFNGEDQMSELEKSITPALSGFAADDKHINLVREQCRKSIAEFVRNWLLREEQWRTDRFKTVKVVFEDEDTSGYDSVGPTIILEEQGQ
ncbi:MAG: hypothetical protein JXR97_16595 [Planctomycetes bacterium]|nr:hypothetical protein [Planctomycetota bacterium]